MNKNIAILTACMGLGTYNPALHLRDELIKDDINSKIFLYENFIIKEKRENIIKYQNAFHKDLRLAIAGHKLMGKINDVDNIDEIAKCLFLEISGKYDVIAVLSGNWVDILCRIENKYDFHIPIVFIHLDCEKAPSWQNKIAYPKNLQEEIWLLGKTNNKAKYYLYNNNSTNRRVEKVFLYGGGWGMGNYLDYIEELSQFFLLDVLLHSIEDIVRYQNNNYYMFPDTWNAWDVDDSGDYFVPKLNCCYFENESLKVSNQTREYNFFEKNLCVVSKPGGGSILDSVSNGTPIVFLEPISKHEMANAYYYIKEGLSINISEWKKSNYSTNIINTLKCSLNDYVKTLSPLSELFVNL